MDTHEPHTADEDLYALLNEDLYALLDDDPERDPGLLYDDDTYEWVER